MLLGSHKYFLYKPHKLSWALSQILPTYYPTWAFHKKYSSYYYQNRATKLYYLHKKPKIIYLVGKIQKAQQNPLKSPLLHDNIFTKSYKAQILLWHLFYKAQYYFGTYFIKPKYFFSTYFTKPKCYFGTYFTKPKYYFDTKFYKAQMLFWHLILQNHFDTYF